MMKQPKPVAVSGVQATYLRNRINALKLKYREAVVAAYERKQVEPARVTRARKIVSDWNRGSMFRDQLSQIEKHMSFFDQEATSVEGRALFANPATSALSIVDEFDVRIHSLIMKLPKRKGKSK